MGRRPRPVAAAAAALVVTAGCVAVTVIVTTGRPAAGSAAPVYLDAHYPYSVRAADLVSRMTLAEKVGQLRSNNTPAIPRLGVQQYTYWSEGQHGLNALGANSNPGDASGGVRATSFPTNFAATMTWDPQLIYQESTAISDEARGFLDKSLWDTGQNNLGPSPTNYGSLTYWAPLRSSTAIRDRRWPAIRRPAI
jgi:beta-glucosidase